MKKIIYENRGTYVCVFINMYMYEYACICVSIGVL